MEVLSIGMESAGVKGGAELNALLPTQHQRLRRPARRDSPRLRRGCSSMVEQQPSKLNTRVRFPSPALPLDSITLNLIAAVAQSVERVLGKDEVMGSSPISSSVECFSEGIGWDRSDIR